MITAYDPYDWQSRLSNFDTLATIELTLDNVADWLSDWSELVSAMRESEAQIYRDLTEHTTDDAINQRFEQWMDAGRPAWERGDQALKQKYLALRGYAPDESMAIPWQRFEAEAALFRDDNVAISAQATKIGTQYERVAGNLEMQWQGESVPIEEAQRWLESPDRPTRQAAWQEVMMAYGREREQFNAQFLEMLQLRRQLAANADFADYQAYRWQELGRFDYTPDDCATFRDAILHEVVPVARQLYAELQADLGLRQLRPWDTSVDRHGEPIRPFDDIETLEATCADIFANVDPVFGAQFTRMRDGGLDLASRPGKAPGAYCNGFPLSKRAYIFMNAVGTNRDVTTLLHEGGHAFHFEAALGQPLVWATDAPMEFCEVASMGMELLAEPYLTKDVGGFYTSDEAQRTLREKLRDIVTFLPYMAVVDGFQDWLYTAAPQDVTSDDLDHKWAELWDSYMVGVDWGGYDIEKATGWHRKAHIFSVPFYYIEYGLAQLGAIQLWRNALNDHSAALADYKQALALGGTRSLPDLFQAAGLRFAFDRDHLRKLMAFMTEQMADQR